MVPFDITDEQGRLERMELLKRKISLSLDLKDKGLLKSAELLELSSDLKEYNHLEVIERCRHSLLEFTYEFFSEDNNPGFQDNVIPEGTKIEDAPDFHSELCKYLDNVANSKKSEKLGWSVARGHAKSTFLSQIFPVYAILYKKPCATFIVIISETSAMAQRFVDFSRNALKFNTRIHEFFGKLLNENPKANERDNVEAFVTGGYSRCMVLASSTSKQLRGIKFGNSRPTTIIADDLESSKNTASKEMREDNIDWWAKTIEPIGEPTTKFLYMGTLVHSDGLLPYIMKRPDYISKIYPAILEYPNEDNQHLWDEFERIYTDVENLNRDKEADEFYFENKELMDKGVRTLWNTRFPYYKLLKTKLNIGSSAFNSEYLNVPSDKDSLVFSEDSTHFYKDGDLPANLEIYSFWDVAITGRGDFNAIITIGRERKTGIIYVLDATIVKVKMHEALEYAVRVAKQWGPRVFGVETVQAQVEMARQLQSRLAVEAIYRTNIRGVKPRGKKEFRIEQLQPLVEQGLIRFRKEQKLLLEQLYAFPAGSFDDGPDALEQCVSLIKFRRGHLSKPKGL